MNSPDDDGPSPLQYARHHRLVRPWQPRDTDIERDIARDINLEASLHSLDELRDIEFRPPLSTVSERLVLDEGGRYLLTSILRPAGETLDYVDQEVDYVHPFRKLKLELPLLLADGELDFQNFLRSKNSSQAFEYVQYDSMCIHDEQNERISWSVEILELPAQYERLVRTEKLEVDQETLIWLQCALKNEASNGKDANSAEHRFQRTNKLVLDYMTPPLSPACSKESPLSSSSTPNIGLEFLSDHTSPNVYAAKRLNEAFIKEDSIRLAPNALISDELYRDLLNLDDLSLTCNPLDQNLENANASSPGQIKVANLKMDEIFTPPTSIRNFRSDSNSIDMTEFAVSLPIPQNERLSNSQDDFDAFFNDVIEFEASKVRDELENEQLQEADSTMRIKVPRLDLSIPTPPWQIPPSAEREQEETREIILQVEMMKLQHLPATTNERMLTWVPFPEDLGKGAAHEEIYHDKLVEKFKNVADLGLDIDPETLSWKPAGLRILDDGDEAGEEELEVGVLNREPDLEDLVRKRKIDFDNNFNDDPVVNSSRLNAVNDSAAGPSRRIWNLNEREGVIQSGQHALATLTSKHIGPNNMPITMGNIFSASDEISRFLEIQTGEVSKKQKTLNGSAAIHSELDSRAGFILDCPKNTWKIDSKCTQKSALPASMESPARKPLSSEKIPVPAAAKSTPRISRPIIVSSTLLSQQRQLVKAILSVDPSLRLISRDFLAWSPASRIQPPSPNKSQQPHADQEADIIISPSTGIILTNLQKIKQKPLPGQSEFSAVRQRILRVCSAYERLFVLVCASATSSSTANALQSNPQSIQAQELQGGPNCDTNPHHESRAPLETLQPSDIEALASLGTFAATLGSISDVTINFIPAITGQEPLATARWISGVIDVNPLPNTPTETRSSSRGRTSDREMETMQHEEWPLLQDETTWELALRKAGMNAFAAQGLLLALRESAGSADAQVTSSRDHGFAKGSCDVPDEGEGAIYGLPAFILMMPFERKARFAGLMGGVRVLDRVGRLFDKGWSGKV